MAVDNVRVHLKALHKSWISEPIKWNTSFAHDATPIFMFFFFTWRFDLLHAAAYGMSAFQSFSTTQYSDFLL